MKSSWSSLESSSKDRPLVSGINIVENTPESMKKANISRLATGFSQQALATGGAPTTHICFTKLFVPPISFRRANPTCAMTAPNLPDAAEIPCAVLLYRVGNASPGVTPTVEFGPKFEKKLHRQYRKTKVFLPASDAVSLPYAKPVS